MFIFLIQGHSRTVIGVEESHQNGNITLLVFDPACSKAHMEKLKDRPTAVLAQPLRKYLSSMTKDQYQIVAVVGMLTESEWNVSFQFFNSSSSIFVFNFLLKKKNSESKN